MELTEEQVEAIERRNNVYVDAKTGMMQVTGSRDDEYGWQPVPEEWIKEAEDFDEWLKGQ